MPAQLPPFTYVPRAITKVAKEDEDQEDMQYGVELREPHLDTVMTVFREVHRAVHFDLENDAEDFIEKMKGITATYPESKLWVAEKTAEFPKELAKALRELIDLDLNEVKKARTKDLGDCDSSSAVVLDDLVKKFLEEGKVKQEKEDFLQAVADAADPVSVSHRVMVEIEKFGHMLLNLRWVQTATDWSELANGPFGTEYKDKDAKYDGPNYFAEAHEVDGWENFCEYLLTYTLLLLRIQNEVLLALFGSHLDGSKLKYVSNPVEPVSLEKIEYLEHRSSEEWDMKKCPRQSYSKVYEAVWKSACSSTLESMYEHLVVVWLARRMGHTEEDADAAQKHVYSKFVSVREKVQNISCPFDPSKTVFETDIIGNSVEESENEEFSGRNSDDNFSDRNDSDKEASDDNFSDQNDSDQDPSDDNFSDGEQRD